MIADGRDALEPAWWVTRLPRAWRSRSRWSRFNLLGDGLRDRLDPAAGARAAPMLVARLRLRAARRIASRRSRRRAARAGCSCSTPTGVRARHRPIADFRELLRRGDLLVVNDTRVHPRAPLRARAAERRPRRAAAGREGRRRRRGTRWRKPGGRAPGPATALEFARRRSTPRSSARGDDGRCRAALLERRSSRTSSALGHVPLPPYIQRARRARPTASATRPSSRASPAPSPRPPPACTSPPSCSTALAAARHRARRGHAARRPRHLQAGHRRARPRAPHGRRALRDPARRPPRPSPRRASAAAASWRSARPWCARSRRAARSPAAASAPGRGRDRPLHHARAPASRSSTLLLTNFHLPRSTLLMLVCAFAGRERVLAAYREAIARGLPLLLLRRRDAGRARWPQPACDADARRQSAQAASSAASRGARPGHPGRTRPDGRGAGCRSSPAGSSIATKAWLA